MKPITIHIGKLILEQLQHQERSASWLARQINMEESSCRRMLQRPSIDTGRLQTISNVLKYNFFLHYFSEKTE